MSASLMINPVGHFHILLEAPSSTHESSLPPSRSSSPSSQEEHTDRWSTPSSIGSFYCGTSNEYNEWIRLRSQRLGFNIHPPPASTPFDTDQSRSISTTLLAAAEALRTPTASPYFVSSRTNSPSVLKTEEQMNEESWAPIRETFK
jgi:hypothetical protein